DQWYREREPRIKADEIQHKDNGVASANGATSNGATPDLALIPPVPPEPDKPEPHQNRRSLWLAGSAAILVVAYLLGRYEFQFPIFKSTPAVESSGKLRLFVRPFHSIAEDQAQAEFTEGLTIELNTKLGKLDPAHLGVIAPTSSKQLADKSISELARRLKVDYVLEGSVRRPNDKVRVDVTLIAAKDETPLWLDSYTDSPTDILKVQDEVAEGVAQKLLFHLYKAAGAPTVDAVGYNSYLSGRRYWALRDLARSVPSFQAAVRRLPDFAPAHAGLACAYTLLGQAPNAAVPQSVSVPQAKAEAHRALELDPANA